MSTSLDLRRAWRLFYLNVGLAALAFLLFIVSRDLVAQMAGAVLISWVWISSVELLLQARRDARISSAGSRSRSP